MSKTTTPSPYMTRAEAAEYLNITTRGLDLIIADGRLKAYQLGSRVIRLRRDEIDSALQPYGDGEA